jgi:hypothetical protein
MKLMNNLASKRRLTTTLMGMTVLLSTLPICHAGVIGGPKTDIDVVKSNSTVKYTLIFRADEEARVEATGDGDVDIRVYDENNNLVASDILNDNHPVCTWTPKWKGKFYVKVINNTSDDLAYRLTTN